MPKIESVRPGEAFASTLGEHPLPELLMGILRGNLTGALVLDLGTVAPNTVYFRDGVPVSVHLPAAGVSLAGVMLDRGQLTADAAAEITTRARVANTSESRVIERDRIVAEGALRDGMRARARMELERLFDVGSHGFVFTEGAQVPRDADLAVLQSLPIIYAGLARQASAPLLERFVRRWGEHRFRLADTYPRGVDPFEWGPEVEAAVAVLEAPETLSALQVAGLDPRTAAVVLATLQATDMLEVHDPLGRRRNEGPSTWDPAAAAEGASFQHDQVRASLAARLDTLADAHYFEVLRIAPSASLAEIERAHAQLLRRLEAVPDDIGSRALRAMYDEAARVLRDPARSTAYRSALLAGPAGEGARRRTEAEPKILRTIAALAEGRAGEAAFWLDWASRLEPARPELQMYRELLMLAGAPPHRRPEIAELIAPSVRAAASALDPKDRALGALACVEASLGEAGAERRLDALGPVAEAWRPWFAPGGRL